MAEKVGSGKGRGGRPKGTLKLVGSSGGTTNATGNGRPVDSLDNLAPDERLKAIRANEAAALISYMTTAVQQQSAINVAAAALKAAKDAQNETINLAMAALKGTTKGEFRTLLAERQMSRKDLQDAADRMARHRRTLALPTESEPDMLEKMEAMPEEAKDAVYWEAEGYKFGIVGDNTGPPKEMQTRFGPHFDTGYRNGQARRAQALNPDRPVPMQAPPEEPGPAHPGEVSKAAVAKAKAALDKIGQAKPADEFEASPEELEKQVTRPKPEDSV